MIGNEMFTLWAQYVEQSRYWNTEPDETQAGGVFAVAHAAECMSANHHSPCLDGLQIVGAL